MISTSSTRSAEKTYTADNFVHVSSYAGRIVQGKHQLVFRVDDKDSPDGEGKILVIRGARVDHAISCTDAAVGVTNDGEFNLDLVFAMRNNISQPILPMDFDSQCKRLTKFNSRQKQLERNET